MTMTFKAEYGIHFCFVNIGDFRHLILFQYKMKKETEEKREKVIERN